jgi:hypothetical protein
MGVETIHRLQEILLFLRRDQSRHRPARSPRGAAETLSLVRHEEAARVARPDA